MVRIPTYVSDNVMVDENQKKTALHSHHNVNSLRKETAKYLAFDSVLSQLKSEKRGANVMYLGDSENDNPAFRKSDIPIGILSDARLNPVLDCKYMLDFDQLPLFLRGLMDNDFIFSEDILPVQVTR
jgi:hypothetical protein